MIKQKQQKNIWSIQFENSILTLPESSAPSAEIFTNQGYKYYIYTAVVASGQAREMCLLCPELTLFLVLC